MLELDHLTLAFQHPTPSYVTMNVTVKAGEILAITGPSGVGKSTLLTTLAGFQAPYSGNAKWQGKTLLDQDVWQRPLSLLFQSQNLFPHLSVRHNIRLGAHKNKDKNEIDRLINELSDELGISDTLAKRASDISGGQQQRVGLARTLLSKKPILLLDEPFSALDKDNRIAALSLVKRLTERHHLATLLVTHDDADITLLGASELRLDRQPI